jgi:hypothetical protein
MRVSQSPIPGAAGESEAFPMSTIPTSAVNTPSAMHRTGIATCQLDEVFASPRASPAPAAIRPKKSVMTPSPLVPATLNGPSVAQGSSAATNMRPPAPPKAQPTLRASADRGARRESWCNGITRTQIPLLGNRRTHIWGQMRRGRRLRPEVPSCRWPPPRWIGSPSLRRRPVGRRGLRPIGWRVEAVCHRSIVAELVTVRRGNSSHHQPWRRAQRSSSPLMTTITPSTRTSWPQCVLELTITFIP